MAKRNEFNDHPSYTTTHDLLYNMPKCHIYEHDLKRYIKIIDVLGHSTDPNIMEEMRFLIYGKMKNYNKNMLYEGCLFINGVG